MRFSSAGIRAFMVVVTFAWTGELAYAQNFFWIVDEGTLYRIDVDDLETTSVGNLGVAGGDYGGLAYDPSTDILYGLLLRGPGGILVEIDRLTGAATPIGNPAPNVPGAWFSGFDISPTGDAIARTLTNDPETASVALYRIDLSNGEATRKVASPNILGATDFAYAPDGRLYDISRDTPEGVLLRSIDDVSGVGTTVSRMSVSDIEHDVALGFNSDDQMLYYLSYPNGLYRISPATGDTEQLVGFSGLPTEEDEYVGTFAPMPNIVGDFNGNEILDVKDIDDLTWQSASRTNLPAYDLNADSLVDKQDITIWVKDLFNTWMGDVDLDGEFSSSDLVDVLASGTFKADVDSAWSTGDFNGDGRTNASDLAVALADGGFGQGARGVAAAVPEPTSAVLLCIGLLAVGRRCQTSSGGR